MATTPTWLRDEPVDLSKPESASGNDKFDIERIVAGVIDLVQAARPPITVSLSGNWGVGKSTIAQAVVDRLNKLGDRGIPACLIDAWTSDVDDLRRQLVIEATATRRTERGADPSIWRKRLDENRVAVAKELDEALLKGTTDEEPVIHVNWRDGLRDAFGEGKGDTLVVIAIAVLLVVLGGLFGSAARSAPIHEQVFRFVGQIAGTLLGAFLVFLVVQSGIVIRNRSRSTSTQPARESVVLAEKFRTFLSSPRDEGNADKVVVVVDNLDRLSRRDALTALAEIRSLVEIKNSRCLFLIPIDRNAFVDQLGKELDGPGSARDYLDKFFNVDLPLVAPATVDLRSFALDRAGALWPNLRGTEELQDVAAIVAEGAKDSPRLVTRLLNGIATRRYLLDDGSISLQQLAIIETLTTWLPGLAPEIAHDARTLVDARYRIVHAAKADRDKEALSLVTLTLDHGDEVAEDGAEVTVDVSAEARADQRQIAQHVEGFLIATSHVPLDAQTVQRAVLLRTDPIWRSIPDAAELRAALGKGDATFAELVDKRSDRQEVVRAAIEQTSSDRKNRWFSGAAREASSLSELEDPGARRSVAREVAEVFIATPNDKHSHLTLANWTLLAEQIPISLSSFVPRIAAQSGALSQAALQSVPEGLLDLTISLDRVGALPANAPHRQAIMQMDDGVLARLFSRPPNTLAPLVAQRYADILQAWDGQDVASVELPAERLTILLKGGALPPSSARGMAENLSARLSNFAQTAEVSAIVLSIADMVSSLPASEAVDRFADALAGHGDPRGVHVLRASAMDLTDEGRKLVADRAQHWLQSADPSDFARFVAERGQFLRTARVDASEIAGARWVTKPSDLLLSVALQNPSGWKAVLAAARTPNWQLATQLAQGLGREKQAERAGELAEAMAPAVSVVALRRNAAVGPLLSALHATGAHKPVVAAIADKIASQQAEQLLPTVIKLGQGLESASLEEDLARAIVRQLSERKIRLSASVELEWLARRTRGGAAVRRMFVSQLRSRPTPNFALTRAAALREPLARHREVAGALISLGRAHRAAARSAASLLQEAARWNGAGDIGDDAAADLDWFAQNVPPGEELDAVHAARAALAKG
jgi:hypothetical protein